MNDDRLQQLLAAERAASTGPQVTVDDVAKDAAIVGHLRTIAGVGVVGALTASTATKAATTATSAAGLATGSVAGFGFAKVAAVVVVAAVFGVGAIALRRPATESVAAPVAVEQAPSPTAVVAIDQGSSPAAVIAVDDVPVPAAPAPIVEKPVRPKVDIVAAADVVSVPAAPSTTPAPSSLERYDLAEAALRAGRFDEAATSFAWWLKDHPADVLRPEAALSLIEALYRSQRFDELIAAAPAALVDVDVSRRGDVERLRAEAFVHLRRCDDAEVAFTKARSGHARDLDVDDVSAALSACRAASPR